MCMCFESVEGLGGIMGYHMKSYVKLACNLSNAVKDIT